MIGIDSQCVSYLIDAIHNVELPTDDLAAEKIALFRTYLYTSEMFYVTQTVSDECAAISDKKKRDQHIDYLQKFFRESRATIQGIDPNRLDKLKKKHAGEKDIFILLEAEKAGFTVLLTYDFNFINHLKDETSLSLMCPSEYWKKLKIIKGSRPVFAPHGSNPLSQHTWWKW